MVEIARRSFITGLIALVAAPAIVRAGSLMPVKADKVLTIDDIAALLSRRIDHAERVMRNNLMRSIYGDLAPASDDLFGIVMNADLDHVGDRAGAPVQRWPLRETTVSIGLNG